MVTIDDIDYQFSYTVAQTNQKVGINVRWVENNSTTLIMPPQPFNTATDEDIPSVKRSFVISTSRDLNLSFSLQHPSLGLSYSYEPISVEYDNPFTQELGFYAEFGYILLTPLDVSNAAGTFEVIPDDNDAKLEIVISDIAIGGGITNLKLVNNSLNNALTWNNRLATKCIVERSVEGAPFDVISNSAIKNFNERSLTPGTFYLYRVRLANKQKYEYAQVSNTTPGTAPSLPPIVPSAINARALDVTRVQIKWNYTGLDEDWFDIGRVIADDDGNTSDDIETIATVGCNISSYTDTLEPGKLARYFVRSSNKNGVSDWLACEILVTPIEPYVYYKKQAMAKVKQGAKLTADELAYVLSKQEDLETVKYILNNRVTNVSMLSTIFPSAVAIALVYAHTNMTTPG